MPFVCNIRAQTLVAVLRGVENVNNKAIITVTDASGMSGTCQDDTKQMLCDWDICEKAFDMFSFFKTSKKKISFRVGVADLLTNLTGAQEDDMIELFLNDNPTFIGISYVDKGRAVGNKLGGRKPKM